METILKTLGFNQEEIKTYIFLLEKGPISAGVMAKQVGIPRSSLYGFLAGLMEQGIVGQSLCDGVKLFFAESPEKISLLFSQQIDTLQQQQKLYSTLLPALRAKESLGFLSPKFQLFEGEEGLRHALKDMLLYEGMETQALWPIKDMVEILSPEFFRYLNKVRIRNNLYARAIWPQDKIVDIRKYPFLGVGEAFKREIRIAPKGIDFSMGYWIYGDKVVFISSRKENFGFIINSREFIQLLLAQFELLWKQSKPLTIHKRYTDVFIQELSEHAGEM